MRLLSWLPFVFLLEVIFASNQIKFDLYDNNELQSNNDTVDLATQYSQISIVHYYGDLIDQHYILDLDPDFLDPCYQG